MACVCGKSRCPRSQTSVNFGLHWTVQTLCFPYARCCLCLSLLRWWSHHRRVSLWTRWSWRLLYLVLSALTYPWCTYTPLPSALILSSCWLSITFFDGPIWIQILCWGYSASHYKLFLSVLLITSCVCRRFLLLLLLLFILQRSDHLLRYYSWLAQLREEAFLEFCRLRLTTWIASGRATTHFIFVF